MVSKKRAKVKKKAKSKGKSKKAKKRFQKPKSITELLILIIILLLIFLIAESGQIFLQFKNLTKEVVKIQPSQPPVYIVDSQPIDIDVYLGEYFANKTPKKTTYVTVSAYSSTVDQTDGDPYKTAFGTHVRDGIVAANFLPVGTVVRFPDKFGDKLFVVEDRMDERFSLQVDIWMPDKEEAKKFGVQYLKIEIF